MFYPPIQVYLRVRRGFVGFYFQIRPSLRRFGELLLSGLPLSRYAYTEVVSIYMTTLLLHYIIEQAILTRIKKMYTLMGTLLI